MKSLKSVVFNDQSRVCFLIGDKKDQAVFAPTSASVLYCLLLDSLALDTSFIYWCEEYGFNTDSIRDFRVYEDCCDTGQKLKNVFTLAQINKLRELLEDY